MRPIDYPGQQSNFISRLVLSHCVLLILSIANVTEAQTVTTTITSSGLGTNVSTSGTTTTITGGTRPQNGGNLFHSFGSFSVGAPDTANFFNNTGFPTTNILSRVTGGEVSNIFGTLKTTDFGNAALWLINPAGIVFGPTASLNVGGSVHVSTADYLRLGTGSDYFYADLSQSSIISSAPVTAFGFLGPTPPKAIEVRGAALRVPDGETLSFIGGDITIVGRSSSSPEAEATLRADSGRINLVSVASTGKVEFNAPNEPSSLSVDSFEHLGSVDITDNFQRGASTVSVSGDPGGTIFIRSGRLELNDAALGSSTRGAIDHPGLGIDIEVAGDLIMNRSELGSSSFGAGDAGAVQVSAGSLQMIGDPSRNFVSNIGSRAFSTSADAGNGNNIDITAGNVLLRNHSFINTTTFGPGQAGSIHVNAADTLELIGGGQAVAFISTSTQGAGNAGSLVVNAETVRMQGGGEVTQLTSQVSRGGTGNAGDLRVTAKSLDLRNGAQITSGVFSGPGRGGNIDVKADTLMISGINSRGFGAGIFSALEQTATGTAGDIRVTTTGDLTVTNGGNINSFSSAVGNSGNIDIRAGNLFVTDDGGVFSSNFGAGTGGNITITAGNVKMSGPGTLGYFHGIFSVGGFLAARAGDISITTGNLEIFDGALISARTAGVGPAGDINITADRLVIAGTDPLSPSAPFEGIESGIVASSLALQPRPDLATGDAGNINLNVNTIELSDHGRIQSLSTGDGRAGGVTVIASESINLTGASEVSSSSFGPGAAGRLNIVTPLVTLEQSSSLKTSATGSGNAGDISVDGTTVTIASGSKLNSSTFGSGRAGTVTIKGTESVTIMGTESVTINGETTTFTSAVASAGVAGTGAAGTVTIAAPTITIANSGTVTTSNSPSNGRAGDIVLNGQRVTISSGGQVTSSTSSEAPGGSLTIAATESVRINGTDSQGNISRLATATVTLPDEPAARGDAGQVSITTPQFSMEGGEITADSFNSSGRAGKIDINAHVASLTGGAQVRTSSVGNGAGGQINLTATDSLLISGVVPDGFTTTISSSTSGSNNAGEIRLVAPTMRIADGAFVTANSDGTGKAGTVTVLADRLAVSGGAIVDSSTIGPGQGGEVHITATEEVQVSGRDNKSPSQITTITAGSGNAGKIFVTSPVLFLDEGAIFANTGDTGSAGSISVSAGQVSMTNGALISSRGVQTATGDAGSVTLQVSGLFSSAASTVSSEAKQGAGGNVSIMAGDMGLTNGTTISAQSAGTKDAGSITLTSARDIRMQDSTVTTFAANASGGNIKLTAPGIVLLNNSRMTSSVNGPVGSNGGNIGIDPEFVVLANGSQILAQATGGNGGNINIITNAFFSEPGTLIDASSQLGISGTITIQSPIQNLSGAIAPLPGGIVEVAALYGAKCAGQKGGAFSSFTVQGRDRIPLEPGELLPTPIVLAEGQAGPAPTSKLPAIPMAMRLHLPGFEGSLFSQNLPYILNGGCHS
jgi:filamentous hemagglutinin family protein